MWPPTCRVRGASYAKRQERRRNPEVAAATGRASFEPLAGEHPRAAVATLFLP